MTGPKVNNAVVLVARTQHKTAVVNQAATDGAQVGVNLYGPDGSVITNAQWNALTKPSSSSSTIFNGTTDDVEEGQWNLYFTPRRAQDAVGAILQNTANITLAYVGGTSIKADLTEVSNTATPSLQQTAFDVYGRLDGWASATSDNLPEGSQNLYEPVIDAIALTALTYPMIVAIDGHGNAYYPDLTNDADVCNIAGVTLNAAAIGAAVKVTRSHIFTENAWGWSPGRLYCAQSGGGITQTPPTAGAIVEVGRVITPTSVLIDVQTLAILI